jgi:hypothetical protein
VEYQPYPYYPPPAPYYAPPPAVVQPAPYVVGPEMRISLSGVMQNPRSDYQLPVGGVGLGLQTRTSTLTMLGLELQALGADRPSHDEKRSQLDALVTGRLFFWDGCLVPFVELAGGIGQAAVEAGGFSTDATQLVGRVGLGLELRLGRHLAFEGALARTGRWAMGDDDTVAYLRESGPFIESHESATEGRLGLALRF